MQPLWDWRRRPPSRRVGPHAPHSGGALQVFKTTRKGKVLLELGSDWRPGSDLGRFCKPTDVAVLADGSAYVSDGYCNARVVYVPPEAATGVAGGLQEAQLAVGEAETPPLPHSVAANNCRRQVEVGDREIGGVHRLQLGPRAGDASGEGILRLKHADTLTRHHERFGEARLPALSLVCVLPGGLRNCGVSDANAPRVQFKVWAIRTGPAGRSYMMIQIGEWADGAVWLVAVDPRSSFAVEVRPQVPWSKALHACPVEARG